MKTPFPNAEPSDRDEMNREYIEWLHHNAIIIEKWFTEHPKADPEAIREQRRRYESIQTELSSINVLKPDPNARH